MKNLRLALQKSVVLFSPNQSTISFPGVWKTRIPSSQQAAAPSSAGPSRLQLATGFSWDAGLGSLKPVSAEQQSESSDEEEQDKSTKVKRPETHTPPSLKGEPSGLQ